MDRPVKSEIKMWGFCYFDAFQWVKLYALLKTQEMGSHSLFSGIYLSGPSLCQDRGRRKNKTSDAKIRRASTALARFSHLFLLHDYTTNLESGTGYSWPDKGVPTVGDKMSWDTSP